MTEQKLYTVAVNLAADRQILIGDVSSISHGEDGTLYISSFSPAGSERVQRLPQVSGFIMSG